MKSPPLAAALAGLSLFVYAGVWSFEFVGLDDPVYVLDNTHVAEGLTADTLAWAFSTTDAANWHPLTWLSLLLDVQLFGMNAGVMHSMNLLLHIANVLLLFWVLIRSTGAIGRSAFVAALFAVHPLHVESVAWISERKDVLSTVFWLLTMAAYAAFVRHPAPRRYFLVIAMFAAGLLAKPMLVTVPFVLLLWDLWPLDRRPWPQLKDKLPVLLLAVASSVVTLIAQRSGGAVRSLESLPLGLRVENAFISYLRYVGKLIWPSDMTMYYPIPVSWPLWLVLCSAAVIGVVSALAIVFVRRSPYITVGWFWFLGTLVPVIGIVQVGHQAIADRYTYVPAIGLFIIVAWGATALTSRWPIATRLLPVVACLVVAPYAITARAQAQHWKSDLALWTRALEVRLGLDPHRARLAAADLNADKTMVAFVTMIEPRHADESMRLNAAQAHDFLGRVFFRHQQFTEAEQSFKDAIRLDPGLAEAHFDLGVLLMKTSRSSEAVVSVQEAFRLAPNNLEMRNLFEELSRGR